MRHWTSGGRLMFQDTNVWNLHPATRFIATMNYGYAGTKELNEALVSTFCVIQMPMISKESLIKLIKKHYPDIREEGAEELTFIFGIT